VVLYRFLFAPVLLAVAVLTTSPARRASPAPRPPHRAAPADVAPAFSPRDPARDPRVGPSHPGSVR
jgi:hypothetical protein